ncbi:MAG: PAS domain-containing protein, partial [Alcaligenaceae bacterium]
HHGYVKILRDRTAQRETGQLLRNSEERFRTLLENLEAAFAIVEVKFDGDDRPVDYRFIEANPAFVREAGVDLRGRWVTEFAPHLEQFWFDTYGRVASTGVPANFENYAEAFGRWFDVRATRVGNPEDRQIAIIFNDVTSRKHSEERLRESEALARRNAERVQLALAAGAIVGTWLWVMPSNRFTVDEAFANAFGLDPELGRDGLSLEQIIETVHPDDKAGLVSAIDEAVKRGGAYAHQYRVRGADGTYRWIEANGRVDLQDDGTSFSFPGVLIDVQERRAMEEERESNAAALRALNDTLEQRVSERTNQLMRSEEQLRQAQKMFMSLWIRLSRHS